MSVELGISARVLEETPYDVMEAMLVHLEEKARKAKQEELLARVRGHSW